MMFAVFLAMSIAMILSLFGLRRGALSALTVCFVLAAGLFLWEVYSPQYGFRMPWLQGGLYPMPVEQAIDESRA